MESQIAQQVPPQQQQPQQSRGGKPGQKVFRTSKGVFVADADDVLGRGTYGVVYRVRSEKDPTIKKAVKTFCPETMDEAEGIPSTTLREINALKTISHPNVMTAEEVVIPTEHSLTDMFVVMELCRGTLKDKIIELVRGHLNADPSWTHPSPNARLPEAYVRDAKIIAWQLLNALAVVHSRGVMHRDLKPVNIMWGFDDLLKLGDFGLARFVRGNQRADNSVIQQTGEVQTMWYRAPEVLLGDEKYGLLVDDWSIGCVIAELFRFRRSSNGRVEPDPLFHGRSDVETLMIIFETLGTPQPHINSSQRYLAGLPYWCDGFPRWYEGTLRQRIPLMDTLGFDLLKQLLRISPSERRAARFLLDHPWFDDVRKDISKFVPWYRGFEEDYTRMMAVDRLPLPRTIRDIAAEEQRLKAAAAAGTVAPAQQRKGAAQSSQGLARGRAAATTAANAPVAAAVVPAGSGTSAAQKASTHWAPPLTRAAAAALAAAAQKEEEERRRQKEQQLEDEGKRAKCIQDNVNTNQRVTAAAPTFTLRSMLTRTTHHSQTGAGEGGVLPPASGKSDAGSGVQHLTTETIVTTGGNSTTTGNQLQHQASQSSGILLTGKPLANGSFRNCRQRQLLSRLGTGPNCTSTLSGVVMGGASSLNAAPCKRSKSTHTSSTLQQSQLSSTAQLTWARGAAPRTAGSTIVTSHEIENQGADSTRHQSERTISPRDGQDLPPSKGRLKMEPLLVDVSLRRRGLTLMKEAPMQSCSGGVAVGSALHKGVRLTVAKRVVASSSFPIPQSVSTLQHSVACYSQSEDEGSSATVKPSPGGLSLRTTSQRLRAQNGGGSSDTRHVACPSASISQQPSRPPLRRCRRQLSSQQAHLVSGSILEPRKDTTFNSEARSGSSSMFLPTSSILGGGRRRIYAPIAASLPSVFEKKDEAAGGNLRSQGQASNCPPPSGWLEQQDSQPSSQDTNAPASSQEEDLQRFKEMPSQCSQDSLKDGSVSLSVKEPTEAQILAATSSVAFSSSSSLPCAEGASVALRPRRGRPPGRRGRAVGTTTRKSRGGSSAVDNRSSLNSEDNCTLHIVNGDVTQATTAYVNNEGPSSSQENSAPLSSEDNYLTTTSRMDATSTGKEKKQTYNTDKAFPSSVAYEEKSQYEPIGGFQGQRKRSRSRSPDRSTVPDKAPTITGAGRGRRHEQQQQLKFTVVTAAVDNANAAIRAKAQPQLDQPPAGLNPSACEVDAFAIMTRGRRATRSLTAAAAAAAAAQEGEKNVLPTSASLFKMSHSPVETSTSLPAICGSEDTNSLATTAPLSNPTGIGNDQQPP